MFPQTIARANFNLKSGKLTLFHCIILYFLVRSNYDRSASVAAIAWITLTSSSSSSSPEETKFVMHFVFFTAAHFTQSCPYARPDDTRSELFAMQKLFLAWRNATTVKPDRSWHCPDRDKCTTMRVCTPRTHVCLDPVGKTTWVRECIAPAAMSSWRARRVKHNPL